MSAYHRFTHRPKALGGTDPVPTTAAVTAGFYFGIAQGGDQQLLDAADEWLPVTLDAASDAYNWDETLGSEAVEIINDADGVPGDAIVFLAADEISDSHYWTVGCTVRLGAYLNPLDGNFDYPAIDLDLEDTEPIGAGAAVRPFYVGLRIQDRGDFTSQGVEPCVMQQVVADYADDGGAHYAYVFNSLSAIFVNYVELHVDAGFPSGRLNHDPVDGALRDGLQVAVYHSIASVIDDTASPRANWPAVRLGAVWGFRYAIGDGVIN